MLEVGREYNIVTLETGENYDGKIGTYESSMVWEVAAVDGTLVKLLGPDFSKEEFDELVAAPEERTKPRDETIMNMASLFFVRAEKVHRVAK